MAEDNETEKPKETILTWRIENAHLCWQKTGEELVSPTFEIDWLNESSWNLCLYPRGIQRDGGYMSYFIEQAKENDGVAKSGAHFELYILAADGSKVLSKTSEGFLSMKKNLWGSSCFIKWETLMEENGSLYLRDKTLTLCCRIFCDFKREMKEKPEISKAFARTRIRKEMVFEERAIEPSKRSEQKIGEVGTILQEGPIVKFSAFFGETGNQKNLLIAIDVLQSDKIKYAICEVFLVDEKREKLFWTNKWIGMIESVCVLLLSDRPKDTIQFVSEEMFVAKPYLAWRFVFTTGSAAQSIENDDYGNSLDNFFKQRLSICNNEEQEPSGQTASDALKSLFYDPLHYDVIIKGKTYEFKVHEMILAPRSEVLKKMLSERDKSTNIVQTNEDEDTLERVIYFLYTDTILDMNWELAKRLYKSAAKYKIELLKEKCFKFIKRNLTSSNVTDIIVLTKNEKGDELKEYVKNFVLENELEVFTSQEWIQYSKSSYNLAAEYLMAKHKNK